MKMRKRHFIILMAIVTILTYGSKSSFATDIYWDPENNTGNASGNNNGQSASKPVVGWTDARNKWAALPANQRGWVIMMSPRPIYYWDGVFDGDAHGQSHGEKMRIKKWTNFDGHYKYYNSNGQQVTNTTNAMFVCPYIDYDPRANNTNKYVHLRFDGMILDGGCVFSTAYDATTSMTTAGNAGNMIEVEGRATITNCTFQNGNGCCFRVKTPNDVNSEVLFELTDVVVKGFLSVYGAAFYFPTPDIHKASLTRVEISGCNSTEDDYGGTIRENGGTRTALTLTDCNIHDNQSSCGGGVYWNASGRTQAVCSIGGTTEIHHNTALKNGGGVYGETRVVLGGSVRIHNNQAQYGAGIYLRSYGANDAAFDGQGFNLEIKESVQVDNNTASVYGGGICLRIINAPAIGYAPNGAPLADPKYSLTISNGTIHDNKAPKGAGVAILDLATKKNKVDNVSTNEIIREVKITGGSVYNNQTIGTDQTGAGIYIRKYPAAYVNVPSDTEYNPVEDYSLSYYEGAGTITLTASGGSIYNNEAINGDGGGMYIINEYYGTSVSSSCNVKVQGSADIYGNTCGNDGAGIYLSGGTFTMTGGTIGKSPMNTNGNRANRDGGGFYITSGSCSVKGGTVSYNEATGDGGGFYVNPGNSTSITYINSTIAATTVSNNKATNGAGTYVKTGQLQIETASTIVDSNEADSNGGGVFVENGTVTVSNATLSNNTATNGNGGGVYSVGTVTVTGGTISGNHADKTGDDCGLGGGIYAEAGSNTITIESGSSITGNTAQHGAGLYAASGTVDVKTNSTITSNAASQNGGGIYANGGTVNVSATATTTEILKQNTAVNGGGIYANGGTVNFSNGVIKGNYASHWGGGLYIPATGKLTLKGTATITGNHVPAGMQGGGVYLAGVVEVGSAAKANDVLKVEDNYADVADATVTNDNRNNIYLPNPVATPASSSNPHVDVITIFNTGIDTNSSSVGFSVPRNFVPVIYCSDANYLAGLVGSDGVLQGSYIFEDSHKYTAYYHSYAPYDPNHIYLSSGTWVNHVTAQPTTGFSVDENGDVTISNEEGLAWLISYVNGLNDVQGGAHAMAGKTVSLTADVNMGDYAWVPIGSMLHADAFKGTFDGNGHTIFNIYCMYLGDQVTGQNLGMFGAVNGNAVIKDVFLDDAEYTTLNQTAGTPYAGGLVETLGGSAKIYNCGVDAKLESLATGSVMGGLVGKMEGGEIHSAFAVAEMTGYTMGGLVGQLTAGNLYNSFANPKFNYSGPYHDPEDPETDINLYVGGLVAENGGSVQNCYVRLERNQSLGSALFGMLAGTNTFTIGTTSYNGTIAQSYAPDGASTQFSHSYAYLYNGATTGLSQQDLYKKADAPYKYDRPNDNKVGTTDKTLTEKLNEWVSGQHDEHPEYAYWKRTTAGNYTTGSGNINDDYPIHKMVGLSNAASPDGLFIEYKYSLDAMLTKYNRLEDGTVWVYDSPLSAMTASGGTPSYESVSVANATKVKLYIDEEASLLQANSNTLTAYTGQTLRNYNDNANRWHNVSSSLKQSGIGFDYDNNGDGHPATFNWSTNPCNIALSDDDDNAFFPSDLPWPETAKMDFYCFYEPEYHWLNLKRRTDSHYHMNANGVPIAYNGNGIGASTNGNETYMVPGKGYLVSIDKDQLIQNKGELNNGTVTLYSVTKSDYNAWAGLLGYNLLGNPYQSYLDFEEFVNADIDPSQATAKNADNLWTGDEDDTYANTYATYDPEQNAYRQYFGGTSSGATVASQYIHPHQGFFVRMTKGNDNTNTTTVTFTNDMRTNTTDRQSGFRDAGQPRHALVNFVVRDAQGKGDIAVLELNRDGDEGAEKIRMGDGTGHLSLGYDGKAYAILFRTEVGDYQPLWFEATEAGTFTLGWDIHNAVFESLTLVDNIAGTSTDMLSTDTYTFQGSPDHYASRFKVVVGDFVEVDPDGPEVPEPVEGSTFAFQMGDQLVVNGAGTLQVFDVTGRQLSSTTLSGTRSTVGLPAAAAGVYVLRLTDDNGTKVQKIVIGH